MRKLVPILMWAVAFLIPGRAQAQGPEIAHDPIGCIIAGQYPKMMACFRPLGTVARGRVYFKPEGTPAWYYVEMKADAPCYGGVLPKPSKALIDKKILYYVQVVDKAFAEAQTTEFAPTVVASEADCKSKLPIAPISRTGPAGVFPSLPAGFSAGAAGLSPLAIAGGAVAIGGGVAIGVTGGGGSEPTPPPTPPTTGPPPSPSPTPGPTPTPGPALQVTCRAEPPSGNAPLTVNFATSATGGTGSYEYLWSFGDGATANRSNPTHVYTTTGTFNANVKVTSGIEEFTCSRTVSVGVPPPSTFPLTVTKTGAGTGTVTSNPAGINCGSVCVGDFNAGAQVTLTASPAVGSAFGGWIGACSGTGSCVVTMAAARTVGAVFNVSGFPLAVTKAGAGTGTVTSVPLGINCGSSCTQTFSPGTVVTLTATAAAGSTFAGWSGACSGVGSCAVTMDVARNVTATFDAVLFALDVRKAGTGSGTVTSSPIGINCGSTCSASFAEGAMVTLTPAPAAGSVFAGWAGDCGGTGACVVNMTAARLVTALFDASTFRLSVTVSGQGLGEVVSTPSGIRCGNGGVNCQATYPGGTPVTLAVTFVEGDLVVWSGDCTGTGPCTVNMTQDRAVNADFGFILTLRRPPSTPPAPSATTNGSADWTSHLEVPKGRGQVALNGQLTLAPGPGVTRGTLAPRAGANRVEAWLTEASGGGVWRFELGRLVEPGTLTVTQGQVLVVTEDSVVFRMSGKPGERVAFTFEARGRRGEK